MCVSVTSPARTHTLIASHTYGKRHPNTISLQAYRKRIFIMIYIYTDIFKETYILIYISREDCALEAPTDSACAGVDAPHNCAARRECAPTIPRGAFVHSRRFFARRLRLATQPAVRATSWRTAAPPRRGGSPSCLCGASGTLAEHSWLGGGTARRRRAVAADGRSVHRRRE